MNRDRIIKLGLAAAVAAFTVWVAMHTYWDTANVPTPLKGEAARNPYYSVEHIAASLGIHTQQISTLRAPQQDAVVLVNNLKDDLLHEPIASLQSWVESGGRLIVFGDMLESNRPVQTWSGIKPVRHDAPSRLTAPAKPLLAFIENCAPMVVQVNGTPTAEPLRICAPKSTVSFTSERLPSWTLSDSEGIHVVRVSVGLGEITVIGPASILGNRKLPREDHAEALIRGAGLRREDTLLILSPSRAEPLFSLLWRLAAPAILFLAAAVMLLILRNLPRFGPPLPTAMPVRRSLAEQIRANARFAWRTHKLGSLRTAARRSLDEAAARQIRGYWMLDANGRAERLAASTRIDSAAIGAALRDDAAGNISDQRAAITLLEVCRRILVKQNSNPKGLSHDR